MNFKVSDKKVHVGIKYNNRRVDFCSPNTGRYICLRPGVNDARLARTHSTARRTRKPEEPLNAIYWMDYD